MAFSRDTIRVSSSSTPEFALAHVCHPFGFESQWPLPLPPFTWAPLPLPFRPGGRIPFRQFSGIAQAGSAGIRFGCWF